MDDLRTLDVTDAASFALLPRCADPGYDHRSCDYWENAAHGSKAARLDWLEPTAAASPSRGSTATGRVGSANPFLADPGNAGGDANPFATERKPGMDNPFLEASAPGTDNPFAPPARVAPGPGAAAPRKLQALGRGLAVVGSYAKVLLRGEESLAYCQFGPLTAYPRAQQIRELYPQLPDAPLPAVITCISVVPAARSAGVGHRLIAAVCADLVERGFTAVEAYPEVGPHVEATSGATPAFWEASGFTRAVDDSRFPVFRRELA